MIFVGSIRLVSFVQTFPSARFAAVSSAQQPLPWEVWKFREKQRWLKLRGDGENFL